MLVSGMCLFWRTVGSNRSKDDWFYDDLCFWFIDLIPITIFFQVFINDTEIYGCLYGLLFFLHDFASKPVGPILRHSSQALNGQVPRSPADDGPASVCANEGEMCPAVNRVNTSNSWWFTLWHYYQLQPFVIEKHGDHLQFLLTAKVFRCNGPAFCRCQCKGKAYYGRKLPLHGKVRTSELRSFESTTSHVAFEPWPWCICIVEASDSRVRVVYFVVFLLKLLKLLLWWHQ